MKGFGIKECVMIGLIALAISSCSQWKEGKPSAKVSDRAYTAILTPSGKGCTVGYSGGVEYTEDGGKTWIAGINRSMCMFGVDLLDSGVAVGTGNGNDVILSKNGGQNWGLKEDIKGGRGKSVSFSDDVSGWISSKFWLGETSDGGQHWTDVPLQSKNALIESICHQGQGKGFVLTSDGALLRTDNGGKEWQTVSTPFPKDDAFTPGYGKNTQGAAIQCRQGKLIAAVAGKKNGKAVLIIKTSLDGGVTWNREDVIKLASEPLSVTMDHGANISLLTPDKRVILITAPKGA